MDGLKKTESFISKCAQSKKFETFAYNCILRLISGDYGNVDKSIKLLNKEYLEIDEDMYIFGSYLYKNSHVEITNIKVGSKKCIIMDFKNSKHIEKFRVMQ